VLFQTEEEQIQRKTADVAAASGRSKPNLQMQQRYVVSRSFVFKSNMRENILFTFMNERFRTFVRMIRFSFRHIVNLIENDEMFQNNSTVVQSIVSAQLMFDFYKLEHSENANAFHHATVL
jgi:hypothetical protein